MRKLITLIGLGAAFKYFFDPAAGATRRSETRDRVLGIPAPARPLRAAGR